MSEKKLTDEEYLRQIQTYMRESITALNSLTDESHHLLYNAFGDIWHGTLPSGLAQLLDAFRRAASDARLGLTGFGLEERCGTLIGKILEMQDSPGISNNPNNADIYHVFGKAISELEEAVRRLEQRSNPENGIQPGD